MKTLVQSSQRICFAVADVKPATVLLPATTVRAALEGVVRSQVLACPAREEKVLKAGDFHPLIAAAFLAFKQHYPLALSPDMIWLTILQGVAQHVHNHAEALRKRLVHHETKIELVVETPVFPGEDSEMLVLTREFVSRIAQHVPANKRFLFETEFSTTTDVDRIAMSVALMDTFEPYFDYVVDCICGIPSVILEGSPEDWGLLKSKVKCLDASDLELSWWTKHLVPLCDQFVRASRGDVDRGHWQNLCKLTAHYGVEEINGWLLKFIPYVKRSKGEAATLRNPVLEMQSFPDPVPGKKTNNKITGCASDMLPSGLSRVPVKFMCMGSSEIKTLEFVAGLVGVTQSAGDLSLRPATGWAVCEGALIDKYIAKLRLEHEVSPPAGMNRWEMARIFSHSLPADVGRFYSETNGARVRLADRRQTCRILPLAEIKRVWDTVQFDAELGERQKRGEIHIQDLPEHKHKNWSYDNLLRIAELDNGSSYVFGKHPKIWRDPHDFKAPPVAESEQHAKAVFLWTGERNFEAFILVATSFTEFLSLLLGEAK